MLGLPRRGVAAPRRSRFVRFGAILVLGVFELPGPTRASETVRLPFWRAKSLVALPIESTLAGRANVPTDAEREQELLRRVRTLLFPPADLAVDRLLPTSGGVESLFVAPPDLVIRLRLPAEFLTAAVTDELLEQLSRQLLLGLDEWPELEHLHLAVIDPLDPSARRRTLSSYLPRPEPALAAKSTAEAASAPVPVVRRSLLSPAGSLAGKVIFVSQAHGFLDYDNASGWTTQREGISLRLRRK